MLEVFDDIAKERARQDKLWGTQNHAPIVWSAILSEETGEVAKEAMTDFFGGPTSKEVLARYRTELVQTAAVCVAAVEALDRQTKNL